MQCARARAKEREREREKETNVTAFKYLSPDQIQIALKRCTTSASFQTIVTRMAPPIPACRFLEIHEIALSLNTSFYQSTLSTSDLPYRNGSPIRDPSSFLLTLIDTWFLHFLFLLIFLFRILRASLFNVRNLSLSASPRPGLLDVPALSDKRCYKSK